MDSTTRTTASESTGEFTIDAIASANDVDRWARRIFGDTPPRQGVLQVVATWRHPNGALEVMSTDADAPRCPEDGFALALGRARADAILTTGAILRQEPELRHTHGAGHPLAMAMADWREKNGPRRPAATVIMTRSRDLDLDHPIFESDQVFVFTGDDAPTSLGIELARRGAMLMSDPDPSPRSCLARLTRAGYAAITIEAGPHVARTLYEDPVIVDQLMMTTYLAPALDERLHRGVLIDEAQLLARFGPVRSEYPTETAEGPWTLRRFAR